MKYLKQLLDQIGLSGERIEMFHMSSAMGAAFAEAVTQMIERVRNLGPNPVKKPAHP